MKVNKEYIIERILEKKKVGQQTYYLVKWQDYSKSQSSWEPAKNLQSAKELIYQFEETLRRKDKSSNESTRIRNSFQSDLRSQSTEDFSLSSNYIVPDKIRIRKVVEKNDLLLYKIEIESRGKTYITLKSSEEMMRDHPDLMINFLESKIKFI